MTRKVFIIGYYGAGNAGDEAILEGLTGDLRTRIPNLHFVVVSADPATTSRDYNVESISNSDLSAVIAAARDCDVIILGGGGLLNDYWAVTLGSLFAPSGATLNYCSYVALAALYAKPLILYAIGVGPLSTRSGRLYTRMVAELAQTITVRDEQSKALLEESGVDATRVHVTGDPAFLLTYPLASIDLPRPILGVALRNWSTGIDPETWESQVASALDRFLDRNNGSVLFLPFQRSTVESDNDVLVAERVRGRMRVHERATVLDAAGAAGELAGAIGRCDLVLGMRYHSVLFAMQRGIPTVGLVYDPKVRNLFASAECEEYALDLDRARADVLLDRLDRAFRDAALPGRFISFSSRMSAGASQNAQLATEVSNPAALSESRWWLDELSGEAAFSGEGEIKRAIAERRSLESGQDRPYDVICLPGIEWDYRWMRPQQLMSQVAARGHRVFFVSVTGFLAPDGPKFAICAVQKNVWEVKLASPEAVNVNSGSMPDQVRDSIVDALAALAREFAIDRAACVLHLSTWAAAAYKLRSLFGWRIIYDCMDDWSGFAWMPDELLANEQVLVGNSDLVVVTAQKLWDKWSPLNRNTILVRNAADPEPYQRESAAELPVDIPKSGPVVGFIGVIDSWFDVELVHFAAIARPQYFFALIGAVYTDLAARLRGLPNLRLFGHQPYDRLPAYLRRFDACIIPFKINAVTRATDPVKFYEYLAQGKPVVSTPMPELEGHREIAYLAEGSDDFVRLLDVAVAESDAELIKRRKTLARENSWVARAERFEDAIERTFEAAPACARILFAYQMLSVGGIEIALQNRVEALRRRGCSICLVFLEEIDGRILFEGTGIDVRICQSETELANVLTGFRPDWIVSMDTPEVLPVAHRIAPWAGLIYEVHSSYPPMLSSLADRSLFAGLRGVIVPSTSQRDRIRPLMAVDKPVEVVPNALSPAFLRADDDAEVPPQPVILWVGRLDSLKGWRRYVDIADQLRNRVDAEFWLVSAGPSGEDSAVLPELIKSLGLTNRFRWMPAVAHSKMPGLYRAAAKSGGCLVSTSASESFGMAVLEAMACGCPVVAPDVVGLRDLVRHSETGRLYPPGELAAACEEIIETLHQPAELRRIVTERAAGFASTFSPERAADRFLAVLADWSSPGDGAFSTVSRGNQSLSRILAAAPEGTTVVIVPPSVPWTSTAQSNRNQSWARAFARCGCLVFYCDPYRPTVGGNEFTEVENGIFVANVPLEVFARITAPLIVADSSSLAQLSHFCEPRVLYECRQGATETSTYLHSEWLARAVAVTVSSDELRDSVAIQRPDAVVVSEAQLLEDSLVSAIIEKLKAADPEEKDPVRLKVLLEWRERQVNTLLTQIRDRDRPAVEILREAVDEQKRVLAERDKGIAFLRAEVAGREKIIAQRGQAIEFLKKDILHRDEVSTLLQGEVESSKVIIQARQNAIEFLQREVAAHRASLTFLRDALAQREKVIADRQNAIESLQGELVAQSASMTFLRGEVAQRENIISDRQNAIEFLQSEVAAQSAGMTFLRDEVAQREKAIADRQNAIEFLQSEVTGRDAIVAAQLEGIEFLRKEVAQRELVINDHQIRLRESEAESARLREMPAATQVEPDGKTISQSH